MVLGYYETKRKERAVGNTNGDKPSPPEPGHSQNKKKPPKQGEANGGNPPKVLSQKLNTPWAIIVGWTSIAFIGDNSNTIPIREVSENKGAYFNTRIMEID